jgi:hypothetical protein
MTEIGRVSGQTVHIRSLYLDFFTLFNIFKGPNSYKYGRKNMVLEFKIRYLLFISCTCRSYKIFVSGQIKTKTKYPKNQFIKVLTVILLEDVKECLN